MGVLSVFENNTPQGTRGRPTRMIEDIEEYYKQVKDGKVTVDEVCEKLGIGKSTFYRNLRRMGDIKPKPRKVTHIEKFAEYEELVKAGKISVAESCRQMNIAVSTYYELRKRDNSPREETPGRNPGEEPQGGQEVSGPQAPQPHSTTGPTAPQHHRPHSHSTQCAHSITTFTSPITLPITLQFSY